MVAKLTKLTHKAIQLHRVAESSTICSSRFRRPVRKLFCTPSCMPLAGLEPTIPVFKRSKTIRVLDSTAIGIGLVPILVCNVALRLRYLF
jgi:hypothetical protein